jgi:hypothetical protein
MVRLLTKCRFLGDLEEEEAKMTWADNLDLNFVLTISSRFERITSQRQKDKIKNYEY